MLQCFTVGVDVGVKVLDLGLVVAKLVNPPTPLHPHQGELSNSSALGASSFVPMPPGHGSTMLPK